MRRRHLIFALPLAAVVVLAVSSAQAAPGALDTSFGTGGKVLTDWSSGDDEIDDMAVLPNGKLIAGGYYESSTSPSHYDFALARYNANGSLDSSFGTGGKVTTAPGVGGGWINGVKVRPDGKIVVAGRGSDGTSYGYALARYNPDGSLDTTFGTGGLALSLLGLGYGNLLGMALQPDGKIVVTGYKFTGSDYFLVVVRYNENGSLDTGFGTGGTVTAPIPSTVGRNVAIQPAGKILAAGYVLVSPNYRFLLLRLNSDGSLDTSFGSGGTVETAVGSTYDFADSVILEGTKILASGQSYNGTDYDAALVRYNPDGSLDTTFGTGGKVVTAWSAKSDTAFRVELQRNGKIVAAGWGQEGTPPLYVFAVARYLPNGALDTSFGTGGKVTTAMGAHDDFALELVIQPTGRIVLGGASDRGMTYDDYQWALAGYLGDTCVVPKLKGRKLAAAKSLIKRKQCKVGKVKKRFSKKVKKGRVISQNPAAGKKVAAATPVNLVASKGPRRH